MTRSFRFLRLFLLLAMVGAAAAGCNKDRVPVEAVIDVKEFQLFNYSGGSAVNAGFCKIEHLESGNARVTVQLNEAFRQPQISFSALITTTLPDDNEVVFAQLGSVPGASGNLVVNPVLKLGSGLPLKYSELAGTTGYFVKVMSGANVQATGEIR